MNMHIYYILTISCRSKNEMKRIEDFFMCFAQTTEIEINQRALENRETKSLIILLLYFTNFNVLTPMFNISKPNVFFRHVGMSEYENDYLCR